MKSIKEEIKVSTATDGKPPVSCWVSVSESLPQTDGTYLTFTKNKVSESIGFTLFVDGQFMSSFVTHWAVVEKPCS